MHPPDADSVLVRHGELGVKSDQVRRKMEGQLADNLRAMLDARGLSGDIEQRRNRLFVHTDHPEGVTAAAADTFGVTSASAVTTVDPTLSAIKTALAATAREQHDGGAFAVNARRAGPAEAHPFSSTDIESDGGTAVWEAIERLGGELLSTSTTPISSCSSSAGLTRPTSSVRNVRDPVASRSGPSAPSSPSSAAASTRPSPPGR